MTTSSLKSLGALTVSATLIFSLPISVSATTAHDDLRGTILQNTAIELQTTLQNTEDDTEHNQTTTDSTEKTVVNNQETTVNQHTDATANTGHNEASRNISIGGNAGMITTGDAHVSSQQVVDVNELCTEVHPGGPTGPHTHADSTNTGDDLESTQTATQQDKTLIINNQRATIQQQTEAEANTGHNTADRNISLGGQAGVIATGDASIHTSSLITANKAVAIVGGESSENGPGSGASIVVDNTGNNARYTMSDRRATKMGVTNNQTADVSQSCGSSNTPCSVITGHNDSNRGIARGGDAGVISTGDAVIDLDFWTLLGGAYTYIQPQSTEAQSSTATTLANTGNESTFEHTSSSDSETTVTNNQTSHVNQEVHAVADTGYNTANRNISFGGNAGVITTGDAVIDTVMGVMMNPTTTFILP